MVKSRVTFVWVLKNVTEQTKCELAYFLNTEHTLSELQKSSGSTDTRTFLPGSDLSCGNRSPIKSVYWLQAKVYGFCSLAPPVFPRRRCAVSSVVRTAVKDVPSLLFVLAANPFTCTWALMIRRRIRQSRCLCPHRAAAMRRHPLCHKAGGRWALRL